MPWCIPHTFEEASGGGCKAARQFFCLAAKRHKISSSIRLLLCFLCLLRLILSSRLLFAHVVAMDKAILLLAVLRFREEALVIFARHHSDPGRYVLCFPSGFL